MSIERDSAAASHLDLVRGGAALLVFGGHLRNLFLVDHPTLSSPALRLLYALTALGHQSVMIFFVLSGLLVGSSVLRAAPAQRFSWAQYLLSRLTRLYAVLIPALLLTAAWDLVGLACFGSAGAYGGSSGSAEVTYPVATNLGWWPLAANALFLQDIFVRAYGSNAPLWSLSFEFWYYLLFPLLVLAVVGPARLMKVAGALALAWFVGTTIALYGLIWLMGAGVSLLPSPLKPPWRRPLTAGAIAAFLATLFLAPYANPDRIGPQADMFSDFAIGLATALLIYALAQDLRPAAAGLYSRLARGLSGMSYTLYLVHLPVLVFIRDALGPRRWEPSLPALATVAAIGLVVFLYAFGLSRLTEVRTNELRARLGRILLPARSVTAPSRA